GGRESRGQGEGRQVGGISGGRARDAQILYPQRCQQLESRGAVKAARPVCAVRRSVVSLAQPGRTWRNVLGSNGLPKAERLMGTTACQQSSDPPKALSVMRCSTRMIW